MRPDKTISGRKQFVLDCGELALPGSGLRIDELSRDYKGGSRLFPALLFWWVVITTLYHLILQSWYQNTAQPLVNTLLTFLQHNKLP